MGAGCCALGFLFVQPSVFLFLGAGLCVVSHLSSLILKTPTFQWLSATLGRHLMKTDALSGAWPRLGAPHCLPRSECDEICLFNQSGFTSQEQACTHTHTQAGKVSLCSLTVRIRSPLEFQETGELEMWWESVGWPEGRTGVLFQPCMPAKAQ